MKRPRVFSRERLVALDLRCRIDMADHLDLPAGPLAKVALDAVVDGEVDGPRREVAEDGGAESAV